MLGVQYSSFVAGLEDTEGTLTAVILQKIQASVGCARCNFALLKRNTAPSHM